MPQGRRTAVEIYEQGLKQPSAVDVYERQQAQRRQPPTAPQSAPTTPPTPTGDANSLLENAYQGAKNATRNYVESPIITLGEAIESADNGDWGPLANIAKATGRGVLQLVDSISAGQTANPQTAQIQTPAIQQLTQERIQNSPALQDIQGRNAQYEQFAKQNPSTAAKVTRGVTGFATQAAPLVATGLLTGGSAPAVAGLAALQSMGQPETLPLNVGLATLPVPLLEEAIGSVAAPIIRRIKGGRVPGDAVATFEAQAAPQATQASSIAPREPIPVAGEAVPAQAQAAPAAAPAVPTQPTGEPSMLRGVDRFQQAIQDIDASKLSPGQKAKAFEQLIQDTAAETRARAGVSHTMTQTSVQTRLPRTGEAPLMRMPENPNPIQQAGVLPRAPSETVAPTVQAPETVAAQSTPDTVFEGLKNSLRTPTSPVSLSGLRERFPNLGKQEFDNAILQSAKDGEIVLHRTDNAGNLPAAERNALVTDGKGNYFIGATLSEPEVAAMQARVSTPTPTAPMEAPGLPGFNPPQIGGVVEPQFGVRDVTNQSRGYTETVGPRTAQAQIDALNASTGGAGGVPPRPPAFGIDEPFPPRWERQPGQANLIPNAADINAPWEGQWQGHPAQQALFQATESLPAKFKRVILGNALEGYRLQRAVLAGGDLSAPFRQGALITMSPQQWVNGTVPRATIRMFRAFKQADYDRINSELLRSQAGQTGQQFGLSLTEAGGGLGKAEEVFVSRLARGLPVVKQSEQAYTTFMNSIRVERFGQIMKTLQNANLSRAELEKGLAAAADWVNDATGRGSFAKFGRVGANIDKTFPTLGEVLFAPRNVASRLNILNPVTYFRNASTPAGRIVMRGQLSDIMQFAATVAGTYQLAKAAGATVETNSDSPDFLKIRFGTWRYDPLAGMQQLMRLVIKTAEAVDAVAEGEKLQGKQAGQSALDASWRFIRGKLAPVPKFFIDWLTQKTVTGQPFDMKKAAVEQIAPMQWNDWVNAFLQEGLPGVAKATPGLFGVGVANYAESPGNVNLNTPLNDELLRHGLNFTSVQTLPGDTDESQKLRAQKVENWLNGYGSQLMANPRYQQLNRDQQTAALTSLHKRITEQANMKRPDVSGFRPIQVVFSVLQNEREKPFRNRQLIVQPPTP